MTSQLVEFSASSGNVFADLGLAEANALLVKAELARTIAAIIAERHLTHTDAAALLGVDQPKVSALARGQLGGFSVEQLLRFLLALQRDVQISISAAPVGCSEGRLSVVSAG